MNAARADDASWPGINPHPHQALPIWESAAGPQGQFSSKSYPEKRATCIATGMYKRSSKIQNEYEMIDDKRGIIYSTMSGEIPGYER